MKLETFLLFLLPPFFVGALPTWPHSRRWGYYPSSGLGMAILCVLVLILLDSVLDT